MEIIKETALGIFPLEIWTLIISYCSAADKVRLLTCCKQLWQNKCRILNNIVEMLYPIKNEQDFRDKASVMIAVYPYIRYARYTFKKLIIPGKKIHIPIFDIFEKIESLNDIKIIYKTKKTKEKYVDKIPTYTHGPFKGCLLITRYMKVICQIPQYITITARMYPPKVDTNIRILNYVSTMSHPNTTINEYYSKYYKWELNNKIDYLKALGVNSIKLKEILNTKLNKLSMPIRFGIKLKEIL